MPSQVTYARADPSGDTAGRKPDPYREVTAVVLPVSRSSTATWNWGMEALYCQPPQRQP